MSGFDIAIIACELELPAANSQLDMHNNLLGRKLGIENLKPYATGDELFVRGVVANAFNFDYDFFGYSEAEAKIICPQQRRLLELSWRALESGRYDPGSLAAKAGVFASCSANYEHLISSYNVGVSDEISSYNHLLGNDKDFVATRIAHKLDCRGPSFTVQSGCSSSLLATHLACQSLQLQECDIALVAASSLILPVIKSYQPIEGMIFSETGNCLPFTNSADGTIGGMGSVVLLLKPYQQAIEDKDFIWSVIKSSACNNDGSSKVNFTAPSVDSQIEVMQTALDKAKLKAENITFIEGHGTGTLLGDAMELTALDEVYGQAKTTVPCYIGSVKANIGHLDAASGIAGLAKLALGFASGNFYPQPYDLPLNEQIDADSRLKLPTEAIKLADDAQYFAAISSLGVGGTNVHLIVANHRQTYSNKDFSQSWYSSSSIQFKQTTVTSFVANKVNVLAASAIPVANSDNNSTKAKLLSIWHEILGENDITGGKQNFFQYGGNSLLAIQLVQKINQNFAVKIKIPQIYDCPNFSAQCELINSIAAVKIACDTPTEAIEDFDEL